MGRVYIISELHTTFTTFPNLTSVFTDNKNTE